MINRRRCKDRQAEASRQPLSIRTQQQRKEERAAEWHQCEEQEHMQRWPAQPKRTYLASQPRPDGEREIPRAHAEREVLRRSQPREKRQAQRCDQDLAQRQQCQASHEAGDLVGQVAVPCMTLASVGAAFSRRRNRSVVLSLLPRWRRVCPSGRALVESFSSPARSAREALVRQRSQALARQRSQTLVRQRSQA